MPEVFISYSRKDIAFAKTLVDAVKSQGIDLWIDWEDIPPSADWLSEIYSAIESANVFVFIVSHLSAQSEVCGKEIEHAILNGKRIIPVVIEKVDPKILPSVVSSINWIFFEGEINFQKAFDTLFQAIQLDLSWVKEHTRLQVRALEWERNGRESSYVLRGKDLEQGELWLGENRPDRNPQPTLLQNQYLSASRREASKRNFYLLAGVSAALIISLLFAVIAFVQRNTAIQSENLRATAQSNAETAGATAIAESIIRATAQANADTQSIRANSEAEIATARQLAAQADLLINQEPKKLSTAVLLSLQSLKHAQTAEGSSALRNGLSLLPNLVTKFQIMPSSSNGGEDNAISNSVTVLKFSPNGKWLGIGTEKAIVSIWDVSTWKEIMHVEPLSHGGIVAQVRTIAFSPNGELMITGTDGEFAQVWDISSGKEISHMIHDDQIFIVGFTPDGKMAISGSGSTVIAWDPFSGKEFYRIKAGTDLLAISSNGKLAASAAGSQITVWDALTGKIITTKTQFIRFDKYRDLRSISALVFSADGSKIASAEGNTGGVWIVPRPASIGGGIIVWDPITGKNISTMQHGDEVQALSFSSDGKKLVTGSFDNTSRVWDVATGRPLSDFSFDANVGAVAFGKNDNWIVSSSYDSTARIWDARTGTEINRLITENDTNIQTLAITPDGKFIAGGNSWGVWVWEVKGQEIVQMELGRALTISAVDYSPDGKMLVTASWDRKVRTWNAKSGALIAAVEHKDQALLSIFSPDGKQVASADKGGEVKIWDPTTGTEFFQIPKFKEVSQLLFSPDGKYLAISEGLNSRYGWQTYSFQVDRDGGVVSIWDISKKVEIARLSHTAIVNNIAFSPDGNRILTAGKDGLARLWDIKTETILSSITMTDFVNIVAISPDGQFAAAAESCLQIGMGTCKKPKISIWNLSTGEVLWSKTLDGRWVSNMIFSPNSKFLVTANNFLDECNQQDCKNKVTVWNAANGDLINQKNYEFEFGLMVLTFNKTGTLLASGGGPSHNGWVDIWEPESGKLISRISYQQALSAAFSPTEEAISIVGNQDGTAYAQVFSLDTQYLIETACSRLKRDLNDQEIKDYLGDISYLNICNKTSLKSSDPNGPLFQPRISHDGNWVTFASKATNLTCGAPEYPSTIISDIYSYNRESGSIQEISRPLVGQDTTESSTDPNSSSDGTFIVFTSNADNLVENDNNNANDVFLFDGLSGKTELISKSSKNIISDSYSSNPVVTDDGRYVVFESMAKNLIPDDNNDQDDIFIRDRKLGETRIISMAENGALADGSSSDPWISPNGEKVLFYSVATNLIENKKSNPGWYLFNQTDKTLSPVPIDFQSNVDFSLIPDLRHFGVGIKNIDGDGTFGEYELAEISLFDLGSNQSRLISVNQKGIQGNRDSASPAVSDGGARVVFASEANNLVEADTNSAWDIFLWDQQTGKLQRIIMAKDGSQPDGHSMDADISGDGRFIVFSSSASNLVEGDINGTRDVFIYDTQKKTTIRIEPMVCSK